MKSILTNYTKYCIFCGTPVESSDVHHLLLGNGYRQLADEDGLTIPVCRTHHQMIHQSGFTETMSKMIGQLAYEKHLVANGETEESAREKFRKRYNKQGSYF